MDQHEYKMEKDENLKFSKVESEPLQDLSHLFKTRGNSVYMITQEEYEIEEAEAKSKRKEKRRLKREAKEMLKEERKQRKEDETIVKKVEL